MRRRDRLCPLMSVGSLFFSLQFSFSFADFMRSLTFARHAAWFETSTSSSACRILQVFMFLLHMSLKRREGRPVGCERSTGSPLGCNSLPFGTHDQANAGVYGKE